MDVVLLSAGGQSSRWQGHLGIRHKALIPVDGEPLAARSARLAHLHRPAARVSVVGSDPLLDQLGLERLPPHASDYPCDVDRFTSTSPYWSASSRTWILFADVYFSEAGMAKIFRPDTDPVRWYGRRQASRITGKSWGELFGVSCSPEGGQELLEHCERVRETHRRGGARWTLGWAVLSSMLGLPLNRLSHPAAPYLTIIDDETEDFDFPKDWENWKRLVLDARRGSAGRATSCPNPTLPPETRGP